MRFENVCVESIAAVFPPEILSSAEIEARLQPLYDRLKLPAGRLELMSGIHERRLWPAGTRPSQATAEAGRAVLAKSALRPSDVELFIHAAVSRDMLEPATASFAHQAIGLPATAQIFDISNACLGFLNAMTIAAGLIESGQIQCALIAAGENSRPLVEETIGSLNSISRTRQEIKPYFANLTIGSGAVAAVLCHRSLVTGTPHFLRGGVARAATQHSALCQGDTLGTDSLAMQTDAEELLNAGLDLAAQTWREFCREGNYGPDYFQRCICHQVGSVHRRRLYETLGLDLKLDFSTFEEFGNTGSVALPSTLARALDAGAVKAGDRVALLGIGSGLNCVMLALEW